MKKLKVLDRVIRINTVTDLGMRGTIKKVTTDGYEVRQDNGKDYFWSKNRTRKLTKLEEALK